MENESSGSTILWGIAIVVGGYWIYRAYQLREAQRIIASPGVQERMEAIRRQEQQRREKIVDDILAPDNKPWIPW